MADIGPYAEIGDNFTADPSVTVGDYADIGDNFWAALGVEI